MGFVSFGKKSDENDKTLAGLINRSLTNITIPDTVTNIGNYCFYNYSKLTSVSISDSVTSIGVQAFNGCNNLSNIEIPKRVKEIGIYAFNNCSSLKSINIPEGMTAIRAATFNSCANLLKIIIPERVISIENCAFQNCSKLTELILLCNNTANLNNVNALNNTPIAKGTGYIYVHKVLLEDYKTATNWVTYADQFRAIEDYPDIINGGEK